MPLQNVDRDEVRAAFTVYIQKVIIHARAEYARKVRRYQNEIYFDELCCEPKVEFEQQYQIWCSRPSSFEFDDKVLTAAFASLAPIRQRILEMAFIQDIPSSEIATRLHCSIRKVYIQKHSALKYLQRISRSGSYAKG